MVINVNLLLIWLPMCKLTQTKLACFATHKLNALKQLELDAMSARRRRLLCAASASADNEKGAPIYLCDTLNASHKLPTTTTIVGKAPLGARLKSSYLLVRFRFSLYVLRAKINALHILVTAADNCKYLHFVCASTTAIASGK